MRAGSAHHQAKVAVDVPFYDLFSDQFIERFIPGQLEILGTLVAGQAKDKNAFIPVFHERADRIIAQIGADGGGVGVKIFKNTFGVGGGGVPDIAAFGVQDYRDIQPDIFNGLSRIRMPAAPMVS